MSMGSLFHGDVGGIWKIGRTSMKPTTTPKTIQQFSNQMDILEEIIEAALKASILLGVYDKRYDVGGPDAPFLHQALMEMQRAARVAASIVSHSAGEVNKAKTDARNSKYQYHRTAYRVRTSGEPGAEERAAKIAADGYAGLKHQQELDAKTLETTPDPAFDPAAAKARIDAARVGAIRHKEWVAAQAKAAREDMAQFEAEKARRLAIHPKADDYQVEPDPALPSDARPVFGQEHDVVPY